MALGCFLDRCGVAVYGFGVFWGSVWDRLGLVAFWNCFEIVLVSCGDGFRIVFGSVQDRWVMLSECLGMCCACFGMVLEWFEYGLGVYF